MNINNFNSYSCCMKNRQEKSLFYKKGKFLGGLSFLQINSYPIGAYHL